MRIGFLFNHDQVHQVAHALPTALALLRGHPGLDVVVATTNTQLTAEVERLAAQAGLAVPLVQLGLGRVSRMVARPLEPVLPLAKLAVYRDNLPFFAGLDVLVVAEKTSLILKTRYGLDRLRIIHTRHGAGDRAIGFDKASAGFDHILVSGPKIRDRLRGEAGIAPDRMSVIGYPKFDLAPGNGDWVPPFADPTLPTVLYNPHPSPHLSSWYGQGRAVLDHFLRDRRYNLIFAPHVMLFHRRFVLTIDKLRVSAPGRIDRRFRDAPNIHIDLGSRRSTDMTYTAAADLYLGDVSSQVYEFLLRPRPCLFLDAHATAWRGDANYAHWQAGEVIGDAADLAAALDRAMERHPRYLPAQRDLFARSFTLTAEPSAERAARAILSVCGAARVAPMVAAGARQGLRRRAS